MTDNKELKEVCVEFLHTDPGISTFFCQGFRVESGELKLRNALLGGKYYKWINIPLTAVMFYYENNASNEPHRLHPM